MSLLRSPRTYMHNFTVFEPAFNPHVFLQIVKEGDFKTVFDYLRRMQLARPHDFWKIILQQVIVTTKDGQKNFGSPLEYAAKNFMASNTEINKSTEGYLLMNLVTFIPGTYRANAIAQLKNMNLREPEEASKRIPSALLTPNLTKGEQALQDYIEHLEKFASPRAKL